MTLVVDADSHLQPSLQWFERQFPDYGIGREPSAFSPIKEFVPPELWPEDESRMYSAPWLQFLQAQRDALADGVPFDDMLADHSVDLGPIHRLFRSRGGFDGDERVVVLDELGIDVQIVSGVSFAGMAEGADGRGLLEVGNSITCGQVAAHAGRFAPVVDIDPTDLDWTIAELTRTREQGARLFNVPVKPVNGKSLSHPDFDPLWAAATDLGMLGYLHSFADPYDPGWANNGGQYLGLSMISAVRYHHQAELLAAVLIGGGVFARFPSFGVVMAEIGGLAWVPNLLQWIDALVVDPTMHAMEGVQPWEHELKPSEYAFRQLRVAPLPNESQRVSPWLDILGDIAVFSTDYPHPEGTPDPAIQGPEAAPDFWRGDLNGASDVQRERFLGGSLAELFARTGDPLQPR